ncbi:cytochrome P450 [Zychaea mexicana]|uniref:cytochrome P450 n=1 Tax=Zychaea mexicana TaxID=64656 RepID=UPI0022FEC8ED|nr:cytochrome P450 [Zychaea mexicana]KAI9496906.1 cytochrome P450 [Zychaea mexicana]
MSQQLTISSFYNNKFAQRVLSWIRDTTGLEDSTTATAAGAAAVAAVVLATTVAWQHASSSKNKPIPFQGIPTPKGCHPLVGHMLTIGANRVQKCHEWHKELGPIFYFKMGVRNVIVIADPIMTHELFVTNGKITSNRAPPTLPHDFNSNGHIGIASAQPENKHWSRARKSVLNALGPRELKEASPLLLKEADEFVDTVATGENMDPMARLMRVSLNFILLAIFGVRTTSIEDPIYKQSVLIIKRFMGLTDFRNIASRFIPVLRILDPFVGLTKKGYLYLENDCKPFLTEMIERALDSEEPNMTKALNNEMNGGKKGYYNNMMRVILDMVVAGTDTTAVTLAWGFLQISTKPVVQKKIQHELDAFVEKNGRLPYFWERAQVPYLVATQRECMRLRPTTDFGLIHVTAEDLEWRGTLIPKGTMMMSNMGDTHLDPIKYPNPEEFQPERFLDKSSETMAASANRKAEDRDQFNFGWGRRVCVGTHLAETQMFNIWVRVLRRCDVKPALDAAGKEVPLGLDSVPPKSGPLVTGPSPFEIRFVPRT